MLPPFNLPEGIFLLITDELASSADFLLYQSLIGHVKGSKTSRTLFLSVSEDLARLKAVTAKSNVNIPQLITSGTLKFVNVLSHVQASLDPTNPTLRPLIGFVTPFLQSNKEPCLVVLDDIAALNWIGFSILDIMRFSRALVAECRQYKATLIIRHHLSTPDSPDELFRHLNQLCSYHLEVRALASGRSGAVSGEIALHLGMATVPGAVKLVPRSSAVQYRLTDAGAVYFERGTSGGVL